MIVALYTNDPRVKLLLSDVDQRTKFTLFTTQLDAEVTAIWHAE